MIISSTIRFRYTRAAVWLGGIVWCCLPLTVSQAIAQDCSRNMLRIFGPQSYVATPDVRALHLTHGFTIECWARLDSASSPLAAIADKGTYGIFLETDSTVRGEVQHNTILHISSVVDSLTNWHHFALVFTPGDSLRLYIDSSEAASEAISIGSLDSNTDSLRIGMSIAGRSWMGAIDEFRIWNVQRSLSEIEQTMYHVVPANDSGLVLYYSFDDEPNSIHIHDFSGHGRDGFVQGTGAEIIPSSSPILDASPGFRLVALESNIRIPTQRCKNSFDTVVHIRNLGSTPLRVDTVGFSIGQVFSIVPNGPFTMPADSSVIDSLRLHFEPFAGGTYVDSLYISSSSDCGGRVRVGVEAAYDSVGLIVSTDTIHFDSVTQCSKDTVRAITVRNTSVTDSVTIVGAVIPPSTGIQILDTFPITLGKSGSATLHVALTHVGRGPLSAAIGFTLDKCSREVLLDVTARRQLEQLALPDTVNLGFAPSTLAGVIKDTIVVVTNTGDSWTYIARAQAGPPGLLQVLGNGRTGIPFGPGDTLQLHVRITASGCGLQIGKLQITSANCLAEASVLATINLIPPASLTAPVADFGSNCGAKDTILYVRNSNPIPVLLDSITYAPTFVFSNGPLLFDTIPAHDSIPVEFEFDPNQNGDYHDTLYFHTTPCGVGTTVLSGNWGYAGVSFDSSQLLFGRGCKTNLVQKTATVTNHSLRTVTISGDSVTGSNRFSLDLFGLPIVLKPGVSKTFGLTYTPLLGHLDTAIFHLFSPEGCTISSLVLRGSREIPKAAWQPTAGNFDTICPNNTAEQTFYLLDKGIDSIDIQSVQISGGGFSLVSAPSSFGGAAGFRVRFMPSVEQSYSGLLTIVGDSCGTSFFLPLHGSGGPAPYLRIQDTNYNFGNTRLGDSLETCIAITNPSCTPIHFRIDSGSVAGTAFQITAVTGGTIARGDTVFVCARFKPTTYGEINSSVTLIGDSTPSRTITLQGTGVAPDLRFHPSMLDFGYVLRGTNKEMMVYDTNFGNLGSQIIPTLNSKVFSVATIDSVGSDANDSIPVTFAPLQTTGLIYDTLYLSWIGHRDSVILRGVGTEPGLQLSAVGLDFGNVHVGQDSTLSLYLFATTKFPTVDSINIVGNVAGTFSYTVNKPFPPYSIRTDSDSLIVFVQYAPHLEQADTGSIIIYSGGSSWTVPLTGRGVEAHVRINGTLFDFDSVTLGDSVTDQPVRLTNTGGYPLFVKPIVPDSIFYTTPDLPDTPIAPGSSRLYTITFKPVEARQVVHTLQLQTTSPDPVPPVTLLGTGVYPAGTGPSFGFTVASVTEEPGEFDSIPVSMNGIRLNKIDADSLTLDFQFDPQMVRILGADEGAGSFPVTHFARLNSDTVEATIATTTFNPGTVMRLHTEALLGPHPLSYIHVVKSQPSADQTEPLTDGAFNVADCAGPIQGVVFAEPYATNSIVPNPAVENARLQFTLGLDGPVAIDIYNSIGQLVRHLDAGSAKAGAHSVLLDVSNLPQGSYVYRLTSLEYHSEGSLVIMR